MDFFTFCELDKIVKNHTESYVFVNNSNLDIELIAYVSEESKEIMLSKIDSKLPLGMIFSHTYEDGKLVVDFKKIEYKEVVQ